MVAVIAGYCQRTFGIRCRVQHRHKCLNWREHYWVPVTDDCCNIGYSFETDFIRKSREISLKNNLFQIAKSFWKFTDSTAVSLPCSAIIIKNDLTTGTYVLNEWEFCKACLSSWSASDGYPILQHSPGIQREKPILHHAILHYVSI